MDWKKIERDVKIQASSLLTSRGGSRGDYGDYDSHVFEKSRGRNHNSSISGYSADYPSLGNGSPPALLSNNLNESNSFGNPNHSHDIRYEILSQQFSDFKDLIYKQNEKISSLSQQLENSLIYQNKYEMLAHKIQQVENENQNNLKFISNLAREQNESLVQTKSMTNKMEWLEDIIRTTSQDSISKTTFTQFLESCSEQLKLVHISTESARNNTSLCMSFLDSFLSALSQLQQASSPGGNGENPSGGYVMGLEYLTSLGSSSGG
jgi:hypothetical protein